MPAIGKFRAQPLLTEPGEYEGWRIPSEADMQLIRRSLNHARKDRHAMELTALHQHLRGLGSQEDVTDSDAALMQGLLSDDVAGAVEFNPLVLANMKGLGLDGGGHGAEVRKTLDGRVLSARQGRDGWFLANLLHARKILTGEAGVEAGDAGIIAGKLSTARGEGGGAISGESIAEMHYLLKELGVRVRVTEEDKRAIRFSLDYAREHCDGWTAAAILHHLKETLPEPRQKEEPVMPELRRFRR